MAAADGEERRRVRGRPRRRPRRAPRRARRQRQRQREGGTAAAPADRPRARVACALARELLPVGASEEDQIVSRQLYERLSAEDVSEIEAAIAKDDQLQAYYSGVLDSRHRVFLLLSFGVWLSIPAVLEEVALGAEQPPEEVHAMARGPLAAAGGLYEADMVASALASVGVGIESATAGLDFGCSSGRLVRVLAAAYPEVQLARL